MAEPRPWSSGLGAETGADGLVYCKAGRSRPAATGLDPAGFAATLGPGVVRILGDHRNVALICAAHGRAGDGVVVETGRPAVVPWASLRAAGPGRVLEHAAADRPLRRSLGGWHALAAAEHVAYAMADLEARGGGDAALARLLPGHPAAAALGFIGHLDAAAACRVIAAIVDPRWYVKADRPDRSSRLRCHLGLIARSARATSGRRRHRRRLVTAAWKTTPGPPPDAAAPGHFLWRHWAGVAGDADHADLKTGLRFLAYLQWTWLDGLLGAAWCPDRLFVAGHFFAAEPATAAAWNDAALAVRGPAPGPR